MCSIYVCALEVTPDLSVLQIDFAYIETKLLKDSFLIIITIM